MIIFLFLLFFSFNIYPAGFAGHTLLLTKHGQTTFETIDVNALVQSNENKFQPVLFLAKQVVEKVVHIAFADETITCHKKQLFWCVNQHDWVCAEDLKADDLLQTIDKQMIVIDAINIIEQQTEIYSLTVGLPHYLYGGKHAVLAYNVVPIVIGLSLQFAISAGAVQFASASFCVGLAAMGTCIVAHFAKNKNKKKIKASIAIASACNSPQFDPGEEDSVDKKFTTEELVKIAKDMGFEKTNYKSKGQPVFKKGNRYISPDIDSHNGGVWKMADSVKNLGRKATPMGTYDVSLNWIEK